MFDNVIVGVDGRQGGRDALALALRLADPGATLTLTNVHAGTYAPLRGVAPGQVREKREAAERLLLDERARLEVEAAIAVEQSTSPARGLHELAEAREADLLVLGSSHRGAFGRAMLGDDARAGLNGAPCAVALAPQGYAAAERPLSSIGIAYNAAPESRMALRTARGLAARTGARLRALEIVTAPRYLFTGIVPPAGAGIDELVKEAEARMGALEGVEGEARYGAIDPDLEEFSKEVDLLIVGSRAYGPARRLIEGSTSRFLLGHSRAPLLVLPRGVHRPRPGASEAGAAAQKAVSA